MEGVFAGVSVELADDSGFTLPDDAVTANRAEVARLLIARGANVNAVDKNGITPLMYAASIDPDSAMIDLLVKSGAKRDARAKVGFTAVQRANTSIRTCSRAWNSSTLVPSLTRGAAFLPPEPKPEV